MFESVMSVLSALSAFASISVSDGVVSVYVEDVVFDESYSEVVPEEYDEDVMLEVGETLESMAESFDLIEYVADVYQFDGFVVRISFSSFDI